MTTTTEMTMTGTMADDTGRPTIASFRPKQDGYPEVVIASGDDQSINRSLTGLPAILILHGGVLGHAKAMAEFAAQSGLNLGAWVSAAEANSTLNTDAMKLFALDSQEKAIEFMIQKATEYVASQGDKEVHELVGALFATAATT